MIVIILLDLFLFGLHVAAAQRQRMMGSPLHYRIHAGFYTSPPLQHLVTL